MHLIMMSIQKRLTYLLTYSMEHSPSCEANRFLTSQEIPRTSWNPKAHRRIHKCSPPVSILSQIDPGCAPPHSTSSKSILILSSHLRLGLPSDIQQRVMLLQRLN
jgi:hypothetical protein